MALQEYNKKMHTAYPSNHPGLSITLKHGRRLGYAEYGDPHGKPVLYFPGTPSSRLLPPPIEATAAFGARLFVLERPGYGLSDFQKRRQLLDWPDDVASFADSLGLDRFPVVGVSGGGPYAAACAFKLPGRISRAAIAGGVGPTDLPGAIKEMPRLRRWGAGIARGAPWLLTKVLWIAANPQRDPERFFARMVSGNSPVDQGIISRPEVKAMLMENYREATRSGLRGFAQDSIILSNPWGFRPEDITIPVHLWHGEADANVSISAARYLAEVIPNCQARFLPGQGHWLFYECWKEILGTIIA
jgi:pimeloyl-ACP methyl ester carboxylesterase